MSAYRSELDTARARITHLERELADAARQRDDLERALRTRAHPASSWTTVAIVAAIVASVIGVAWLASARTVHRAAPEPIARPSPSPSPPPPPTYGALGGLGGLAGHAGLPRETGAAPLPATAAPIQMILGASIDPSTLGAPPDAPDRLD